MERDGHKMGLWLIAATVALLCPGIALLAGWRPTIKGEPRKGTRLIGAALLSLYGATFCRTIPRMHDLSVATDQNLGYASLAFSTSAFALLGWLLLTNR